MKRNIPTMHDVAKLAGVSQTTVSLIINEVASANISDETREKVHLAVEKLGYRPNSAAKMLRTNRSNIIGFLTDDVAITPFAGGMIKGAQELAWANNKLLMVVNVGNDPDEKKAAVDMMIDRQVDGIIYGVFYHRVVNPPFNIYQVPTVLIDCFCPDRSLPSVVPDEVQGGRTATLKLIEKGHRRIGFISLLPDIPAAIGRLEGYKQALQANGIPFDPTLVVNSNTNADEGYNCAVQLMNLPEPPTALFCGTDRIAMGAYDALRDLGRSIPRDVGIIGFDDQQLISKYLRPALSTMALPHYEMGQWAVDFLLKLDNGVVEGKPPQHLIECPFIKRDSF
jgi:LacI family transcriptional regulator